MIFDWKKISVIVTTIIMIGGAAFGIEQYFAKQKPYENLVAIVEMADKKYASIEDIAAIDKRITINTLRDTLYKIQQRLWLFEDRYFKTKDPALLRDIEELKDTIKILKQKIFKLETE